MGGSERSSILVEARRLIESAFPAAEALVARDAGGLLVRLVDSQFADLADGERRRRFYEAVSGLRPADVGFLELLTEDEALASADAFRPDGDGAPTWSERLEVTPDRSEGVRFASDLDYDLDTPPIVTFYSLRGGVGRSTALVSASEILAHKYGKRVLCVDMDLEAPGLAELFGVEGSVKEDHGVLALLEDLEYEDANPLPHILPVDDSGLLYCLPAGKYGARYADRLASLDVELWYRETRNPLHRLVELLQQSTLKPDVILVDSRTGFSPIAAPLLFDVSDMAVVFFHPHSQARAGTALLTAAMLASKTSRPVGGEERCLTPEPRFVVSPMPSGPSSVRLAERAEQWIVEWLAPAQESRKAETSVPMHVVPYVPDIAFADRVDSDVEKLSAYEAIADWVLQLTPSSEARPARPGAPGKDAVLEQLSFETGTAETQGSLLEDFVVTRNVERAADADTPLIVGRKGTGKTALFRWLAERPGTRSVVATAPNQYRSRPPWSLGAEGLAEIGGQIERTGQSWRAFWLSLVTLAVECTLRDDSTDHPSLPDGFEPFERDDTELAALRKLSRALEVPRVALVASDWLQRTSAGLAAQRFVLFDGLDTAFGHESGAKLRRTEAIAALLAAQAEIESRVSNLPLKIMLRHDIWDRLAFENKSHFFGRRLQLRWEERADYYRVVLKQAVRSSAFAEVIAGDARSVPSVDEWSREEVDAAWTTLIGERMKGEQTAFTWNWVWNRLADGNGDHSPRSLIQLFSDALDRERSEHERNPYDRSIIRPRLLITSLASVSERVFDALVNEEFPELTDFAASLEAYGRTPVPLDELNARPEDVDLASDAGLISVQDDGTGKRIARVPDLYRHALRVTRRGPS